MTFPEEYKWLREKLKVEFPKFKIFWWESAKRERGFSFGIRNKDFCLEKIYKKRFLKQHNAPIFVDKVIKRWKGIIENSIIPRYWEKSIFDWASKPSIFSKNFKKMPIKILPREAGERIFFKAKGK